MLSSKARGRKEQEEKSQIVQLCIKIYKVGDKLVDKIEVPEEQKVNIAIELASKGFKVFRLVPNGKTPFRKGWQQEASSVPEEIKALWAEGPKCNIGISAGHGLIIIDLDVKDGKDGIEELSEWELLNVQLPGTLMSKTTSGGQHVFYRVKRPIKNRVGIFGKNSGIDVRATGGYVVAPGSVVSGKKYKWMNELPIAEADEAVYALIEGKDIDAGFVLPEVIELGTRNDTLFKYAAKLQGEGTTDEIIEENLIKANERCQIPLSYTEIKTILNSVLSKYEKGPGEDLSRFHKYNSKGSIIGIFDTVIVEDIIESENFFMIGDNFFYYENGVFREDPKGLVVREWIQKRIYPRYVTARVIDSVYRLLSYKKVNQKTYYDLNNYPDTWINFKNGMFDVVNWAMKPHEPKYLAINQIAHNFNPDEEPAPSPAMKNYLEEALPSEEDRNMMFEYVGYCMTKDMSLERFMLIKGRGGTGKSILIKLITLAVGVRNTSNIPMQKLNERFYAIELLGKLLNACSDIPSDVMRSVDTIKQLVSADFMMGERKRKDPISFKNCAKLLFSGNSLPLNLDENSNAFYRRLLILKMDTPPKRIDVDLEEKLFRNIDCFIYAAVYALSAVYMLGCISESPNSKEEVKNLHKYSDTVTAFLEECTIRQPGSNTNKSQFYEAYVQYCYGNSRTALGRNSFYRSLRESNGITLYKTGGERVVRDVIIDTEALEENEKYYAEIP